MMERLENIKKLIGTEASVCKVEDGAPCFMCGDCVPEEEKDVDFEDEERFNYEREAFD